MPAVGPSPDWSPDAANAEGKDGAPDVTEPKYEPCNYNHDDVLLRKQRIEAQNCAALVAMYATPPSNTTTASAGSTPDGWVEDINHVIQRVASQHTPPRREESVTAPLSNSPRSPKCTEV